MRVTLQSLLVLLKLKKLEAASQVVNAILPHGSLYHSSRKSECLYHSQVKAADLINKLKGIQDIISRALE